MVQRAYPGTDTQPGPSIPRQQRIRLKGLGRRKRPPGPFHLRMRVAVVLFLILATYVTSALRIDHRMYAIGKTLATAHASVARRIRLWNVFRDVWGVLHPSGGSPPLQSVEAFRIYKIGIVLAVVGLVFSIVGIQQKNALCWLAPILSLSHDPGMGVLAIDVT